MIRIRYNTHALEGFKMKNFGFQQQNECLGLIYTVNQTNTSAKAKLSPV